jgi:hypothetical protein
LVPAMWIQAPDVLSIALCISALSTSAIEPIQVPCIVLTHFIDCMTTETH